MDRNNEKQMGRGVFYLLLISLLLPSLTSCSETDDAEEEFANWQARNETYFEQQYQAHSSQTAASFILPSWAQPSSKSFNEIAHTNCILVDVVETGDGTTSPYFTDSIKVHYSGRLIPSASYAAGYEFDKSYVGTFDPAVDVPSKFVVNSVVEGFATALQHMHRGDRWRVTIPYQLGYGVNGSSSIPGYSTLVFDMQLVDFWTAKRGDRAD